jgi:hypothetical protein
MTYDTGRDLFWEANEAFEYVDMRSLVYEFGRCRLPRFAGFSELSGGERGVKFADATRSGGEVGGDDIVAAMRESDDCRDPKIISFLVCPVRIPIVPI